MKMEILSPYLVFGTLSCLFVLGQSGPLHASCKLDWTFDVTCDQIQAKLIAQIDLWKTDKNCENGGEKCLYKLVSSTATELKATHETPKKHYVDDITFTFKNKGDKCEVNGHSTSETWYAILDYGTNYCNMHNLLTGAHLDKLPGFSETTSDKKCTQYSSADCDVY